MPSAWSSLVFWLETSRNSNHLGIGAYRGTELVFRGIDVRALKEVLVDCEYRAVLPRLAEIAAPVVLDVGAHIGLFSIWLLNERPNAVVWSVEANPRTYNVLARNVMAARAMGVRWETVNAAAWNEDGKELWLSDVGLSMSHRISDHGSVSVRGVTLKTLLARVVGSGAVVDLMKVDIEGSEEPFLCDKPELLGRVRSMVVELHPGLCDTNRVLNVLRGAYQTIVEVQQRASSRPLLLCY